MDTYSNSILWKKKMYPGWMGSATLLTAEQTSGLTKQAEVLVKTPQNHPVYQTNGDQIMNFADAVVLEDNKSALTTNGMATHKSSLSSCVDLFFLIGASRDKDMSKVFDAAYAENPELAVRILLWARDVRGGAGERSTPRALLLHIEEHYPDLAKVLIAVWCKFGRWDDLLVFKSKVIKNLVYGIISNALTFAGNGLCAKWMPRKGPIANELRTYMGLSPKQYRKLLVSLTKVVETPMCAREWESINYAHVPSVAAGRYSKAFGRHDPAGYGKYREDLNSGEAKINAGAVFPYQVLQNMKSGVVDVGIAQWNALPDYLGDNAILPMIDVSGSMETPVSGNTTAMDVAVSLGVYIADKQKGAFKDLWLTFSQEPELVKLSGDNIYEKMVDVNDNENWGMNTNLEKAFTQILKVAVNNTVCYPKSCLVSSRRIASATLSRAIAFNDFTDASTSARYDIRCRNRCVCLSPALPAARTRFCSTSNMAAPSTRETRVTSHEMSSATVL